MTVEPIANRQEQISTIIRRAARNTDQDFNFLLTQARVESGLNPSAVARTSSATGLYQFTNGTWIDLVRRHGDQVGLENAAQALRNGEATPEVKASLLAKRTDPALSAELAARFAIDNAQALARSGHGKIGSTELYLAHFLGPKGADVFLTGLKTKPDAPAAAALPQAAQANANIFFNKGQPRSFAEIFGQFQRKFEPAAGAATVAAAAQPAALSPAPVRVAPSGALKPAAPVAPAKPQVQDLKQAVAPATPTGTAEASAAAVDDLQGVAANALRQVAQNMGVAPSDMPLDEAALGSFLRNFTLQQNDPSLTPIVNDAETRDASSGAGVEWSETSEFGAHPSLSGHAIGGKLLARAVEGRDAGSPADEQEQQDARSPAPVSSRAAYADYASLWGGASKAAPSQILR